MDYDFADGGKVDTKLDANTKTSGDRISTHGKLKCNRDRIYATAEAQHHAPTAVSSFHGVQLPKRLGMGSFPPYLSHLCSLRN